MNTKNPNLRKYSMQNVLLIEYHDLMDKITKGSIPKNDVVKSVVTFSVKFIEAVLNKEIPEQELSLLNVMVERMLPKYERIMIGQEDEDDAFSKLYTTFETDFLNSCTVEESYEEIRQMLKETKMLLKSL